MSTTPSQNVAGILLPPSHSIPEKQPKMNPRREAFVRHYVETGNATKAAILAGYSEKSAAAAGSRLLTNPEIKGEIDGALSRQAELSGISATYVLEGIRDEIEHLKRDPERSAAASQAIFRGQELLGKHLKLFTDKVEQDTQITVTIERIGGSEGSG